MKKIKLIELTEEGINRLTALATNVPENVKLGIRVEPEQLKNVSNGDIIYIGHKGIPWLKVKICKIRDFETIEFNIKGFIVNEPKPSAKITLKEEYL